MAAAAAVRTSLCTRLCMTRRRCWRDQNPSASLPSASTFLIWQALLAAWREARTGYPWIDAAMTQLRQEGWIHHLARHAVACFLTRGDLWQSVAPREPDPHSPHSRALLALES